MALQTYIDVFNVTTGSAGTTYARTGYGFQPKALIVWATVDTGTADAVNGGHGGYSIGFASSTTERGYAAISSEDNQNSADTDRMMGTDAVMGLITISGTTDGLLDISAIGSDGVTFIVDDNFAAAYRVMVLAIGGTDITNAKAGAFTMATAAATQDVTDPGFQPDAVLMVCSSLTALGLGTSSILSFGAAAGATPVNAVVAGLSRHSSPTMITRGYCRAGTGTNGDSVVVLTTDTTPVFEARARVSAWLSNGFTLTYDDQASVADYVVYLALKGGAYAIGDLLTQTDTTTDITESPGFQPAAGVVASACRSSDSAGTLSNHHEMSVGAFVSASSECALGHWDENNTGYSECARAQENDACYVNIASDDTLEGAMHITTVNSTGFVARMADADPAQSFVWYLVVGADTSVSLTVSDGAHAHAAETPALTQANVLAINDGAHAHTTDGIALTEAGSLSVGDGTHAHSAESPALETAGATALTLSDGQHVHATDPIDLAQAHTLATSDGQHSHTSDPITLQSGISLSINDGQHGHATDSISLTQASTLTVSDGQHGHATDAVVLTQAHTISVSDGRSLHAAESPALDTSFNLTVSDGQHGHATDALALTQAHVLALSDGQHAHTTDAVSLVLPDIGLTVADCLHALSSDSPVTETGMVYRALVARAAAYEYISAAQAARRRIETTQQTRDAS